jgi:hypothetical protein
MRQSNYKADTNSASKQPAKTATKYGNYGSDTFTAARKNVRRNVKRSLKDYDYEDDFIEEVTNR